MCHPDQCGGRERGLVATAVKHLSNPTVYYLVTGSPQRLPEEMLMTMSSLSVKMMLKLLKD
jgi:hypothetical protein